MTAYVIFGATSAIAEHTARVLAGGNSSFCLIGRSGDKLATIAADLRVRGASKVETLIYDFSNSNDLEDLVAQAIEKLGFLDKALIAFGTLTDQTESEQNPSQITKELALNFTAPAILSQHIANHMKSRKQGHIAVITSVAGDRGRGSNYVYGSAKGGLGLFLEGLRHKLASSNIEVLDIRPGFVDTPMTRHFKKGPLWAKPQDVGAFIAEAMQKNKGGRFYVPSFWFFIMLIVRSLPVPIFHKTKL